MQNCAAAAECRHAAAPASRPPAMVSSSVGSQPGWLVDPVDEREIRSWVGSPGDGQLLADPGDRLCSPGNRERVEADVEFASHDLSNLAETAHAHLIRLIPDLLPDLLSW